MPIHLRDDGKPVVEFDPQLELSPFTLFRRLRENQALRLVDVRADPKGMTLEGSIRLPDPDWDPDPDTPVVLFDDTGAEAVELARGLQARGYDSLRALFGGLELYAFSLDPEVVGRETYLKPVTAAPPAP